MSLAPFLAASPLIQIHAAAATLALVLGPVVIFRRRRDALHKQLGYVWVTFMALAALSSFGIWGFGVIGPFSPIHILSVLALWTLWTSIRAARARDIRRHELALRNLYWRGLIVAGLLNFLPGRSTNRSFFPENPAFGWVVIGVGLTLLALPILRNVARQNLLPKNV